MFAARHTCKPQACPDNLVFVSHNHTAHVAQTALWTTATVLLFVAAFSLLVGRWRDATPTLRRILRPVYLAGGISVVLLAVGFIVTPFSGFGGTLVSVALIVTFTAGPLLFPPGVLGPTTKAGARVVTTFRSVPPRPAPRGEAEPRRE